MSLPTTDTIFASVRAVSQTYIEYPFIEAGDNLTKVYRMICQINASDYDPTEVALDDTMSSAAAAGVIALPFPVDAAAYFVGDFNHSPMDGGLLEFERVFANIPQQSTDPSGSEIFTFPGLPSTSGTSSSITISSMSYSSNVVTMNLTAAHGMSSGDNFRYYFRGLYVYYGRTYSNYYYGNGTCSTGTAGSTIKMFYTLPNNFSFSSWGRIYPGSSRGRKQVSRRASTQLEYDYFLPGITPGITTSQQITLPQRFEAYRYTEGNTVATLNSGTVPTAYEYNGIVDSDGFLVLDSSVERWKGNILRRVVKSIRAI
jgi:hypothetical protein